MVPLKTIYSSQVFYYYSKTPITIFHSIYMLLNSPCSYRMVSKLYWMLNCDIVLKYILKLWRHILIVDLAQMQGENVILSNGEIFRFHLITSCSKLDELSLSISSKFKFYLYFRTVETYIDYWFGSNVGRKFCSIKWPIL